MSSHIQEEPTNKVTHCLSCCEEIALQAKVCKHCGSYQDWRRHMSLSANVLALLIALVSVLTMFVTSFTEQFAKSELKIVLTSRPTIEYVYQRKYGVNGVFSSEGYYELSFSSNVLNTGKKPGALISVEVQAELDGVLVSGHYQLNEKEAPMKAGDYKVLNIAIPLMPLSSEEYIGHYEWNYKEIKTAKFDITLKQTTIKFHLLDDQGKQEQHDESLPVLVNEFIPMSVM